MNNYLSMDRASEAAARDLAEVRKLIEGMSAFVSGHAGQQQASRPILTTTTTLPKCASSEPSPPPVTDRHALPHTSHENPSTATASPAPPLTLAQEPHPAPLAPPSDKGHAPASPSANNAPLDTAAATQPPNHGVVVQVTHLVFNRTVYFQLSPDATIEPLVNWLRVSFSDPSISGMVLQYKGFDGLWKCLLNRDDSLKRILKQTHKGQSVLQMRVPREQDLLSSGYTDRRLLALTKSGA